MPQWGVRAVSKHNKYGERLQLFRYTASTAPTSNSHGWRNNVAGNVAAMTMQDAISKIEAEYGDDLEIYSVNHAGYLLP